MSKMTFVERMLVSVRNGGGEDSTMVDRGAKEAERRERKERERRAAEAGTGGAARTLR